jgi:predicted DCC family thiol-disulfide oxidoreductase YuxK
VALQAPEADALLPGMTHDRRMASWHIVAGGRVYSGGAAFAPLLRLLGRGGPAARLLDRFPLVGDVAYRAVAGRRSWLGRLIPGASAARARERIDAAARRDRA